MKCLFSIEKQAELFRIHTDIYRPLIKTLFEWGTAEFFAEVMHEKINFDFFPQVVSHISVDHIDRDEANARRLLYNGALY